VTVRGQERGPPFYTLHPSPPNDRSVQQGLIEGFFSRLAPSVLRHIRVSSKHELKQRLIAFIGDINREPVVHTWRYKIDNAA